MRQNGLRISDVATLARKSVQGDRIRLHTMKTGDELVLPLSDELKKALDLVPIPRGSIGESQYFFWSGNGTKRAAVRDVTRTMRAVFDKAGIGGDTKKRSHRFRHTLATEILGRGGNCEDVEAILGTSAALIRKHYAQWSIKRQERIESLLKPVLSGTDLAQTQRESVTC
jgi:integrase